MAKPRLDFNKINYILMLYSEAGISFGVFQYLHKNQT